MSEPQNEFRDRIGNRRRVRSATKLTLAIVVVSFLLHLGSLLPGIDRVIPATDVSLAAVVRAIATLAVVSLLVHLASDLAALTRLLGGAPRVIVENVSSVVYWLVLLVAVIVAHWGLAPAVTAVVPAWVYDVGFLVLSLPPLAFVAARLYHTLDPAAELVTDSVVGASGGDGESARGDDSSTGNEPDDDSERTNDAGDE